MQCYSKLDVWVRHSANYSWPSATCSLSLPKFHRVSWLSWTSLIASTTNLQFSVAIMMGLIVIDDFDADVWPNVSLLAQQRCIPSKNSDDYSTFRRGPSVVDHSVPVFKWVAEMVVSLSYCIRLGGFQLTETRHCYWPLEVRWRKTFLEVQRSPLHCLPCIDSCFTATCYIGAPVWEAWQMSLTIGAAYLVYPCYHC